MEVTTVSAPQECVTIHGVVTELSNAEKNKTLAGKLTDGRRQYRWFCFTHN